MKKIFDLQLKNTTFRLLHIDVQETPNPNSIKFSTGKDILKDDTNPTTFSSLKSSEACLIAKQLHQLEGIQTVFISKDFITISKLGGHDWEVLVDEVKEVMEAYFSTTEHVQITKQDEKKAKDSNPNEGEEEDDEIVMTIKQLIEEKIRPTIQADGGDVIFMGFEGGVVKVKLQGACTSCPSSEVTLKRGVQNMLQFYVPEVMGVIQVTDDKDELSSQEFDSFENSLKKS